MILMSVVVGFSGCNRRPKDILSENQMVEILTDLQLADAYYNTSVGPRNRVSRDDLVEGILEKHGVSREELDSTIAYYGRNIDDYYKLYARVDRNLKSLNRTAGGEEIDNADDIWPYGAFAVVNPNQTTDGLIFSIPLKDLPKGSSLEWRMHLSNSDGADVMLGVEYENGITSMSRKNSALDRSVRVSLQTDTSFNVKRIFGTMTAPKSSMPLWIDSLRLVKLDFDSLTYGSLRQQRTFYPPMAKPAPEDPDTSTPTLKTPS